MTTTPQSLPSIGATHHQLRLFACLLVTDVLATRRSWVHHAIFAEPHLREATRILLETFDALGRVPSRDTFMTEIMKGLGPSKGAAVATVVARAYNLDPAEVRVLYLPEFGDLIQLCHMHRSYSEALQLVAQEDIEGARVRAAEGNLTQDAPEGGDWSAQDPERYQDEDHDAQGRGELISTGYEDLDRMFGGGWARGEVYMLSGAQGLGKSRMCQNWAFNMADGGYRVGVVSFELKRPVIYHRLDMISTGLTAEALKTSNGVAHLKEARSRVVESGGEVRIWKLKPRRMDILQFGAWLRTLQDRWDVLVVDYLDLILVPELTRSGNYWEDQGQCVEELQAVAEELDVLMIALTQPGKGKTRVEDMGDVGGSGKKMNPLAGALGISISSPKDYIDRGHFGLTILKNRFGSPFGVVRMQVGTNGLRVTQRIGE